MSSTYTRALSRPTSPQARWGAVGLLPPLFLSASLHALNCEEFSLCPAGRQMLGGSNLRRTLLIIFGVSAALPSGVALAAGDVEREAQIYRSYVACHALEHGLHLTGPSLNDIWNRHASQAEGFGCYSDALRDAGFAWDAVAFDVWLEDLRAMIEGTSMSFPSIANAGKRGDLIAFLEQAGRPGRTERLAAEGMIPGAYLCGPAPQPIGDAAESRKGHVSQALRRQLQDRKRGRSQQRPLGKERPLKIDSTAIGPPPGIGVILRAGMQGDRYSVIFSSVADLQRLVSESCEAR